MTNKAGWMLGACLAGVLVGCGAAGHATRGDRVGADELWATGVQLARAGELVRAEQYLVAAQRAGTPRAKVLPVLLRVCVHSGQQRRALAHLQRALRESPGEVQLWVLAGALAWAVGDLPAATRHLATADAMPATPADVAYWRARVAMSEGQQARAVEQLRAYLARDPRGRFAAWARFWLAHDEGGTT